MSVTLLLLLPIACCFSLEEVDETSAADFDVVVVVFVVVAVDAAVFEAAAVVVVVDDDAAVAPEIADDDDDDGFSFIVVEKEGGSDDSEETALCSCCISDSGFSPPAAAVAAAATTTVDADVDEGCFAAEALGDDKNFDKTAALQLRFGTSASAVLATEEIFVSSCETAGSGAVAVSNDIAPAPPAGDARPSNVPPLLPPSLFAPAANFLRFTSFSKTVLAVGVDLAGDVINSIGISW